MDVPLFFFFFLPSFFSSFLLPKLHYNAKPPVWDGRLNLWHVSVNVSVKYFSRSGKLGGNRLSRKR